jgi:hypothetical protein
MKIGGAKVVDAGRPVTIHVTARDIAGGDNKDPAACAAARACMRELHATEARVHIGRTYLKIEEKWVRYRTSKALRTEIIAFDRGGKFMPGDFQLERMRESDRFGARKNKPRGPHLTKAKPRAKIHTVVGIRHHGAVR